MAKYKKTCSAVIFVARVFFTTKQLIYTVRNKIKKESRQLLEKQKSYSKSKSVKKIPKKLKILI